MSQLYPYLTFNGNCREAMIFYYECLGGELKFQTIGDSPLSEKMPATLKKFILHSTLTKGAMVIMGSDMVEEKGLKKGNSVSMLLQCTSKEEIETYYKLLSQDGQATHPIETTFWGALFGDLIDKYENRWILIYDKSQLADIF